MKTTILLLFLALASCSKDSVKQDPIAQLPPETQTGANTFGVTINGKVYIPRDPTGVNVGGITPRGMKFSGGGSPPNDYTEIDVVDGASSIGFKLIIHIHTFLNVGEYQLKQSNFQEQGNSVPFNHIYFKIWDSSISNYAYYGSVEDQGKINVNKFDGNPLWILSGTFEGKFVRNDNPNEFITINDGRFDLNLNTLPNAKFP